MWYLFNQQQKRREVLRREGMDARSVELELAVFFDRVLGERVRLCNVKHGI